MWPASLWVLLLAIGGQFLPSTNGYRWEDGLSYSSSYAQSRSFSHPDNYDRSNDRAEERDTTTPRNVDALIMDVYNIRPQQNPGTEHQENLRETNYPQGSQHTFQGQQRQQSQLGKDMIFPDNSGGRQEANLGVANRGGSQASLGASVSAKQPSRDIIFPDDSSLRPTQNSITPRCSESGKFFCTEVENYPEEKIENALRTEINKFEQLFGDDVISVTNPDITQRIDLEPGEETLCTSRSTLVYPKAGMTKDNDWQFIVNHENYTQGIKVDECLNPKEPCSMTMNFPKDYTTECKQQYTYRHLVSMNERGKVVKDLFSLPSCCICVLKPRGRSRRNT